MDKKKFIEKITQKKEFSRLPKKDVEMIFEKFDKDKYSDEEKVKFTRKLLMEIFSVFVSQKLLSLKNKDAEWVLKKHVSTRERFDYYEEIYQRIFCGGASAQPNSAIEKSSLVSHPPTPRRGEHLSEAQSLPLSNNLAHPTTTIFDLGAGVNGFSYCYMQEEIGKLYSQARGINPVINNKTSRAKVNERGKSSVKVKYVAVEGMGQLVDLMNKYFEDEKLNARAIHASLFDLNGLKKLIEKEKGHRSVYPKLRNTGAKIVFLFKVLDSLEMMQRDYSKELLKGVVPLVDKVVVSFAVRSLRKREKFKANRKWLREFIKENFKIKDDFELGGERYIVFSKSYCLTVYFHPYFFSGFLNKSLGLGIFLIFGKLQH